jgi:hypothetical protein
MEQPEAVSMLLWVVVGICLLIPLGFSISVGDYSIFLGALGLLLLVAVGCAVVAVVVGITTAPLVWLLSLFSGRGPKRKG